METNTIGCKKQCSWKELCSNLPLSLCRCGVSGKAFHLFKAFSYLWAQNPKDSPYLTRCQVHSKKSLPQALCWLCDMARWLLPTKRHHGLLTGFLILRTLRTSRTKLAMLPWCGICYHLTRDGVNSQDRCHPSYWPDESLLSLSCSLI